MDAYSEGQGWWGYHWETPHPRSIVELISLGSLDAELAALLWLLVEGRVPLVVAANPPLAGKTTTLTALLDFLPPGTRRFVVHGSAEDFAWLPEAGRLGWRRMAGDDAIRLPLARSNQPHAEGYPQSNEPGTRVEPADPRSAYLLVNEMSSHLPVYTWGRHAQLLVRSLSLGYGMGATLHADSLEEVLAQLGSSEIGLTDDEVSHLGVVLILRVVRSDVDGDRSAAANGVRERLVRRIVAAHYVRPLARDAHGHLQRLPPAVLAAWDPERDRFDHFAWGIAPELASRVGRRAGDFEREQGRRAEFLAGLAAAEITGIAEVRAAIAGYVAAGESAGH